MMGRRLSALNLISTLFLFGSPFAASTGAGQAKALEIEQFDADINVLPGGRIHISEAIRFRFTGSWNGIYRDIPVRYETPQGFNYNLDLRVSSVLDEGSQPFEYEESRKGQYKRIKIWVPAASDEVRTVHIEYSVENALRFIDAEDSDFEAGHDELYWNVTGDGWEIPVHAATARVLVPPEVTGLAGSCLHGLPRLDQRYRQWY
jgi:hypothetical protein